ncbi:septin-2 isoform X2 [Bombus huntii]|uniref:septin-2 isoform X2 n=1 Tax=Bombus huntii TaxID=85661 RepID=UPI0021AACCCF|nr:septin-2 isoform X2 [Bombus huntii]
MSGDRDYIGFATLPEQVHRKSVKRGFEFTLMVLGESGLGKSTLINSLFLGDLYKDRRILDAAERIEKTTTIEKKTMDIEERGVRLRLTIVDTPGFGDAVNCEDTWKACSAYIDEQFRQYFTDESGLNRKNIQDNRVHCCLYFIPPYGHGLRQIDLEVLKRLHRKVNVVPVIAKADTLTTYEVKMLKDRILADIEEHEIQIYQFPDCDSDEDEEFKQQDKELKACIPFAVVGSSTVLEVAGKKVRGRQYPWGVVEVENPKHSDFVKLRTMLISTHMQDLKDVTQDVHYENFRAQCISQISQQAIRERSKLKRDSGPHFENSISDTDRLLLQKDEEIRRMQDMLAQMQEKLKATGQVGTGIGLRGRVGSLGNDLDSTDVEKKRNTKTRSTRAKLLMIPKAFLLTMTLVGILSEPQGPAYLPPTATGARPAPAAGHPDEWAGDSANYEFSYEVEDAVAGLNFGHHESRKDNEATGTYHVLLPDGRTQIVDYVADGGGYRPMVRYEGTATYPAAGSAPRTQAATAGSTSNEGYRY